MKRFIYTVEGTGPFPFDMLRYDGCYPVRGVDVMNLTERGHRIVQLRGVRKPTIDRWASFSWYVNMISPMEE
jgi:hypothetical protein